MPVMPEREHHLEIARDAIGAVAVGLVEHEDVGDLEDPRLDRLDVVAQPWHRDDQHRIDARHHVDLVLADAHRLDDHPVEAGGVENVGGVAGRAREPAHRAARRHRADEDSRVGRQTLHADPVAEEGATGERRGRIDAENADGLAAAAALLRQAIDEGALAGARRTGDSDDPRPAGRRIDLPQQLRLPAAAALDDRDRPGDGARLAPTQAREQILETFGRKVPGLLPAHAEGARGR